MKSFDYWRLCDSVEEIYGSLYEGMWEVLSTCGYEKTDQGIEKLEIAAQELFEKTRGDGDLPRSASADLAVVLLMSFAGNHIENGDLVEAIGTLTTAARILGQCEAQAYLPSPASQLATRRHAENYALTRDAIEFWEKNIEPTLSSAKAANELIKIVPLSHKKLAEIISAEKKKRN
jgi:hypothetical protein